MSITAWVRLGFIATIVGVWIYLLVIPMPKLPIGYANGTYVNPCCAPIRLVDGNLFVGGKSVAYYVVEKDKQGPYVLPNARIMVVGGKIQIDRAKASLKLPLARGIELLGDGGPYLFTPAPVR